MTLLKTGLVGLTLATSCCFVNRVNAVAVPADFFATNNSKILQLACYDSVPTTTNWDDYYSTKIKWDDATETDVPVGFRVWVLDADKKPCGLFDVNTAGRYGFLHAYQDDAMTPTIDEGATIGDMMSVLVENSASGTMYSAMFVDASYGPINVVFQGDKGRYSKDILVSPTPIPEPSAFVLFGIGAGLIAFHCRRRRAS